MNLHDKVKQTFQDFWSINLGHICLAATFLFGLGISWQRVSDRMDKIEDRIAVKHESALQIIAAGTVERDLKFSAFSERLLKDEAQIGVISDLRVSIAQIATEMHGLNSQITAFRQELHDKKNP